MPGVSRSSSRPRTESTSSCLLERTTNTRWGVQRDRSLATVLVQYLVRYCPPPKKQRVATAIKAPLLFIFSFRFHSTLFNTIQLPVVLVEIRNRGLHSTKVFKRELSYCPMFGHALLCLSLLTAALLLPLSFPFPIHIV